MSQQIQLILVEDKVKVITPYHAGFVEKCRNLRGSFKAGAWWFDDSIIDYVREAMLKHFGTTGEVPFDNCTLLVRNFSSNEYGAPVMLFDRSVARAFSRDSGARLGDDIVFISGRYDSGGSVKNWRTEVSEATFEMRNFPVPSLELPDVKKAIEEGWVEVKQVKKNRDPQLILKEIDELKSRITELEKEYNSYDC